MVEGEITLRDETVPFSEGKGRVNSGETSNKVVLPSLNCSFGCVAAVTVWWDDLEIDVMFGEGSLDVGGAFVVDDMKFGCVAVGLG